MTSAAVEDDNKTLDPQTYHQVDLIVQELFKICVADRGEAKMGNATVLQLLNEIEKNIDRYLQDFQVSEDISKTCKGIVEEEEKAIKKACRTENREKAQRREQEENEAKQKKRQDA